MTGDVTVVVVGGAAFLCDNSLEGAFPLIRPPFASVANAVGAAIPQVLTASAVFKHEEHLFCLSTLECVHGEPCQLQDFAE